jgi:hypothetical protein
MPQDFLSVWNPPLASQGEAVVRRLPQPQPGKTKIERRIETAPKCLHEGKNRGEQGSKLTH